MTSTSTATLNPKAVSLNPKAVTLNPKAVPLNLKAVSLNPKAVTLDLFQGLNCFDEMLKQVQHDIDVNCLPTYIIFISMAIINPHINFNGNVEEAFNFYRSIFGGEFKKIIRFKDLENDEFPVAEHEADKIMHISLPIGSTSLIGNDVPEVLGRTNERENRSKIAVTAFSKAEAEKIFNALAINGEIEMPIADNPWGSYFGMLRDKYGIEWTVEYAD